GARKNVNSSANRRDPPNATGAIGNPFCNWFRNSRVAGTFSARNNQGVERRRVAKGRLRLKRNTGLASEWLGTSGDNNDFVTGISYAAVGLDIGNAERVGGTDEIERLNAVVADDPDAQWFHNLRIAP